MLSLVRSGPTILLLEVSDQEAFENQMQVYFRAAFKSYDQLQAFADEANAKSTVIYLSSALKDLMRIDDFEKMYRIDEDYRHVFPILFNDKEALTINQLRTAPGIVVMQCIGDMDMTLRSLAIDFHGGIEALEEVMQNHNRGTVIMLTKESISKSLEASETYGKVVYVSEPIFQVKDGLSRHVYKYINQQIAYNDWNDCTVKIYDSYQHYEIHYKRLVFVLEKLGVGLIAGESWGTDAATTFLSVDVYRIKLITYLSIKAIKQILMGLEYDDLGKRIVDYDLFHRKKKIFWDSARTKDFKEKREIAYAFRKYIFKQLSAEDRAQLLDYERQIEDLKQKR